MASYFNVVSYIVKWEMIDCCLAEQTEQPHTHTHKDYRRGEHVGVV
jgi:hypothetical protein